MASFTLPKNSTITKGRAHTATGAKRVQKFKIVNGVKP